MNNAGGFITLHRQIINWEWYQDQNTKDLFLHLLLIANFTDTRFFGRKIKRGQVVTSLDSLAKETGMSIQNIKTAIKHLISTNEITNLSTRQYRIITITKYDDYQKLTNDLTLNQQTPNKQLTNDQQYHNNINNVNKGTNNKSGGRPRTPTFVPPSIEEVRAYCEERKNDIDPEYFVNYYEARNWVLSSGQKMSNWKSTIVTWERRDKNGRRSEPGAGDRKDSRGNPAENRSDYSFLDSTIINL